MPTNFSLEQTSSSSSSSSGLFDLQNAPSFSFLIRRFAISLSLSFAILPFPSLTHSLCVIGDCFLRNSLPGLIL